MARDRRRLLRVPLFIMDLLCGGGSEKHRMDLLIMAECADFRIANGDELDCGHVRLFTLGR